MDNGKRVLNYAQLLRYMQDRCDDEGSIKAWAKKHGMSFSYASSVLRGDAKPGKKILKALKVKAVRHFSVPGEEGAVAVLIKKDPFAGMKFEDIE